MTARTTLSLAPDVTITPVVEDARLLTELSPDERQRAAEYQHHFHRWAFITRRSLLRRALAERLGCDPTSLVFRTRPCPSCGGPHGRPYAVDSPVEFSISSSGRHVALALADRPIGIDIELISELDVVRDVGPQLHPGEQRVIREALLRSVDGARTLFTQIWTRKEALLKATGEGIGATLARDDLARVDEQPIRGWRFEDIRAPRGTVASWALDISTDG